MGNNELESYGQHHWPLLSLLPQWCPTSMSALMQAEKRILHHLWDKIDSKIVWINNNTAKIRTIILNDESTNMPLVMVHGMGSGVGLWALNLGPLSQSRPVYAFDMLGFGQSSRPKFNCDAMLAEMEMVESIEAWRKEIGLKTFILLGHSLGGFFAASYALRYPEHVTHLVLADPWGFAEQGNETEERAPIPIWLRAIGTMLRPFNPFAGIRVAGPLGPRLVARLRPDLSHKYNDLFSDNTVSNYIYHCNAQKPSGEAAFKSMSVPFGWARYPMAPRLKDLAEDVPITMIYGSRSWVDSKTGYKVKEIRDPSPVTVKIIKGSGHHVYADKCGEFNAILKNVGEIYDDKTLENESLPG